MKTVALIAGGTCMKNEHFCKAILYRKGKRHQVLVFEIKTASAGVPSGSGINYQVATGGDDVTF